MDVNDLRALVTVLSLIVFVGIVAWAWSRSNKKRFSDAAQLPFQEEDRKEADHKEARHE